MGSVLFTGRDSLFTQFFMEAAPQSDPWCGRASFQAVRRLAPVPIRTPKIRNCTICYIMVLESPFYKRVFRISHPCWNLVVRLLRVFLSLFQKHLHGPIPIQRALHAIVASRLCSLAIGGKANRLLLGYGLHIAKIMIKCDICLLETYIIHIALLNSVKKKAVDVWCAGPMQAACGSERMGEVSAHGE